MKTSTLDPLEIMPSSVTPNEIEYRKQLLRTLCLIAIACQIGGILTLSSLALITGQPLLLIGPFGSIGVLFSYFLSWGWTTKKYQTSSRLLVISTLFSICLYYWLVGTDIPVPVASILPVGLAVVLLPRKEVLLVGGFSILFDAGLYILHWPLGLYTPPIILTAFVQSLISLAILLIIMPLLIALLFIPTSQLFGLLRSQNLQLQVDLGALRQAEAQLSLEKERLAVTLKSIGDGVITTDLKGRITLLNPVAEQLTGWHQVEAEGKPLEQVFRLVKAKQHRDESQREEEKEVVISLEQILAKRVVSNLPPEVALVARDGTSRLIMGSIAPLLGFDPSSKEDHEQVSPAPPPSGAVLTFQDITEKQRWEEETLKIQKLESLGMVAGGIAHDFNNIMAGVIGNLELARLDLGKESTLAKLLEETENTALRAKALTQQLLTFARGGSPIKKLSAPAPLLETITHSVLKNFNISARFELANNLWLAEIDEGQISQVIEQVVLNSCQAMAGGGFITVRAENLISPETRPKILLPERDYLKLTIQDSGEGIAPEHLLRVFDPYFTTRANSNGLGLTICYSVITRHEGYILVESEPAKGTTVTLYLPALRPVASPETVVKKSSQPLKELPVGRTGKEENEEKEENDGRGRKPRVLVVDDEVAICQIIKKALNRQGYQVDTVCDGVEGLERYNLALSCDEPYQLVILDLTIPLGMGGKETITRLRQLNPRIKAIVTSGYSHDPVMANYRDYGFGAVLAKPFTLQELFGRVKEVLATNAERS